MVFKLEENKAGFRFDTPAFEMGINIGTLSAAGKARPSNAYAAFAGDSRTLQAFDDSTGRFYFETRGAVAWALPNCGHRFRVATAVQYGVGGNTSTQLLARWDDVLADPAGTIVLLISTNDRGSSFTLQQSIDNVTAMLEQAYTAGKVVILGNETQRFGASVLAGQNLTNHNDFHDWLDEAPNRWRNVYGWDTWSAVAAETDTSDGLHQNTIGAKKMGEALATVMSSILPATDYSRPYVVGESHAQPALNANPGLTGTGGSKGTGVTGNLADNWTVTASTGSLAIACSKETDGDGVTWQVLAITGTSPSGSPSLIMRPSSNLTLVEGDSYDVRARVKLDAGSSNILSVTTEARIDGVVTQSRALDGYQAPDAAPAEGFDLLLCTPPCVVPAGAVTTVRGQITVNIVPSVVVSATVRVALAASRIIV
jgi:lysophospholipase L1-like esterase